MPRNLDRVDPLLLALAALAAFAVRVVPFADRVFSAHGIIPSGDADVYYHLRRIELATAAFPRVPDFDRWINYPDGGWSSWPPLFDFVPAALAHVTGVEPAVVAVLWPPLLGALALLPFFAIARRCCGRGPAWLATALFVVLPANLFVSVLGRVDHHVAEVLLQLWVYALLLRDLQALEAGARLRARATALLGVCMGCALLTWNASMMFLWVPAAATVLWLLPPRPAAPARAAARHIVFAFAIAGLVCLPYGILNTVRGRAPFGFFYVSLLQPLLCLVAACALAGVALALAPLRERDLRGFGLRVLAAALLAAGLLLVPDVRASLAGGLSFVGRGESSFVTTIAESAPLLSSPTTRGFAAQHIGYAHLLLPVLALVLAVSAARKRPVDAATALLAFWVANSCALAFAQARFLAYAAPIAALLPALALRLQPRLVAAGGAALGLLAVGPALAYFWWPLLDGRADTRVPLARIDVGLLNFMASVRTLTPSAGDPRRPERKPGYCVFAPWDVGHTLLVVGERPVVANNFGLYLEGGSYQDAQRFYQELRDEPAAVALLERRGCRYVITSGARLQGAGAASGSAPFASRLHLHDGADAANGSGSGRFRLLSAAAHADAVASYKLFQLVEGALLRVLSASAVGARVELVVPRAATAAPYVRAFTADSGGRSASVRVAYPGSYRVLGPDGGELGRLTVSERAVERGTTLTFAE